MKNLTTALKEFDECNPLENGDIVSQGTRDYFKEYIKILYKDFSDSLEVEEIKTTDTASVSNAIMVGYNQAIQKNKELSIKIMK